MSYTVTNFKTKKLLKWTVQNYTDSYTHDKGYDKRYEVRCFQPGLGPDISNYTGKVWLEGPHYPAAHTWYAEGEMINGVLVKVK